MHLISLLVTEYHGETMNKILIFTKKSLSYSLSLALYANIILKQPNNSSKFPYQLYSIIAMSYKTLKHRRLL